MCVRVCVINETVALIAFLPLNSIELSRLAYNALMFYFQRVCVCVGVCLCVSECVCERELYLKSQGKCLSG